MLNLQSGQYHGLNATGGRALDVLSTSGSARAAAASVTREFRRPLEETTRDIVDLCRALASRGLIEIGPSG